MAEDRIIRTCDALAIILTGIAAPLVALAPAGATVSADRETMGQYVAARLADASGADAIASRNYSALLGERPDDVGLATRAYRRAMISGDTALALKSAAALDKAGLLPADGRLLFLAKAIIDRDWATAGRAIDRVESDGNFDFIVPMLRSWVALGAKSGDPVALLDAAPPSALGSAYKPEQRALLLLAAGRFDEGLVAARSLIATGGPRSFAFRLSAAATLLEAKRRDDALALLAGDEAPLVTARAMVSAGKPPATPISGPREGVARLFGRLSIDLSAQKPSPLSLSMGWLSLSLDPKDDAVRLATGRALATADDGADDALAVIEPVDGTGPYGPLKDEFSVTLLVRAGEKDRALAAAQATADKPDARLPDVVRLGDTYSSLDRNAEAAQAYARAIKIAEADPETQPVRWSLYMLRGSALERAGEWNKALPALTKAAELAPDDPTALNYLGYAQIERGQNIAKATVLIKRAAELKPDDPAIADSLGYALLLSGDVANAIVALERAVAGQPGDPTINEHLGDAYWAAGRRYEARYAWRAAAITAEPKDATRIAAKIDHGPTDKRAAR